MAIRAANQVFTEVVQALVEALVVADCDFCC